MYDGIHVPLENMSDFYGKVNIRLPTCCDPLQALHTLLTLMLLSNHFIQRDRSEIIISVQCYSKDKMGPNPGALSRESKHPLLLDDSSLLR